MTTKPFSNNHKGVVKPEIPKELERVREAARRAIKPIAPADENTRADAKFLFAATRADASRNLPHYYLIYFLLVDLLGFADLGRFEKLAWSIPIDFEGTAYLIDYRKFGVGIFGRKVADQESKAQTIAKLINKGVKAANPFFRWTAREAVRDSRINVSNHAEPLFERYAYLRNCFKSASDEAEASKRIHDIKQRQRELNIPLYSLDTSKVVSKQEQINALTFPWMLKERNAGWLALSAIDAFFAWTEHVFIHLAILQGKVTMGLGVEALVGADWKDKFKCALDIQDNVTKRHLDELLTIKRQLRNFMAHGAFGKEGEAFSFHSKSGAVPVAFDHRPVTPHLSLTPELAFDNTKALVAVEEFIAHLWSGKREPAKIYIQDSGLPLILPMASDGTYQAAMASEDDMTRFVDNLIKRFDAAANMDW